MAPEDTVKLATNKNPAEAGSVKTAEPTSVGVRSGRACQKLGPVTRCGSHKPQRLDQADESGRTFLSYLPLFRFNVGALSDGFPGRVHRMLIPDLALNYVAIPAFSINMVKPEVIYPSVSEWTEHRGFPSTHQQSNTQILRQPAAPKHKLGNCFLAGVPSHIGHSQLFLPARDETQHAETSEHHRVDFGFGDWRSDGTYCP